MKSYLFRDDLLQNETRKSMNQNFPSHDLARSEKTYTYLAAGSLAAGSQETPLIFFDFFLASCVIIKTHHYQQAHQHHSKTLFLSIKDGVPTDHLKEHEEPTATKKKTKLFPLWRQAK